MLRPIHSQSSLKDIVHFTTKNLPKVIHHCNQLKNYQNSIHKFKDSHDAVMIDIDFSEKLKVPLKFKAQSQNWNEKTDKTVHSGIMKQNGTKSYHAYLSDIIQDQSFISNVLQRMLSECDISKSINLIVSDNCTSQYNCAEHFYGLSQIANQFNVNVICIFGIAGHGNGEVEHVGGLVKVAIRQEVAAEKTFSNANEMVHCLSEMYAKSES